MGTPSLKPVGMYFGCGHSHCVLPCWYIPYKDEIGLQALFLHSRKSYYNKEQKLIPTHLLYPGQSSTVSPMWLPRMLIAEVDKY